MNLGVFHDDKLGTIEIDPTIIVATTDEVDSVVAYNGATGGAYDYNSGNGYWPSGMQPKFAWLTILTNVFKGWGDPGSTQERVEHGEFGPGSGLGGEHSFDLKGGLTDKMFATAQAKLEKSGFTVGQGIGADGQPIPAGTHVSAEVQANIASHSTGMTPDQIQEARDAYQTYHDIAVAAIPSASPEVACSMVAVCSQNNTMGPTGAGGSPTIDMAVNIANALQADPAVMITQDMADSLAPTGATTIDADGNLNVTLGYAFPAMDANGNTIPDQQIEPGLYQLSELSPDAAARIIGAGLGTPAAQAVEMYRGASPDDVIDSPKLRNFASNIVDPSNPNSITCDRWVARVEYSPPMTEDAAESFRASSNAAYAISAENLDYFASHNSLGPGGSSLTMLPDEAQAVPWIHDVGVSGDFSKYDSLRGKSMKAMKSDRKRKSVFPLTWFDHPGLGELLPEQVAAEHEAEARLRPMINAANPHLVHKSFGDPGNTQDRVDGGRFGAGSGSTVGADLESRAIAHFGAADELVGQQFVTQNGTILDLKGDGHSAIAQIVPGSFIQSTDRAIDAGFVRTSVDTVTTTEPGRYAQSVVLEISQPMTSAQIGTVMDNVKDLDVQSFAMDVTTPGDTDRAMSVDSSSLKYSEEVSEPTRSDIAGMIRDANVAAGGSINAYQVADLLKRFGDPGSTQTQDAHGEFTAGSGAEARLTPFGRTNAGNIGDAQQADTMNVYAAESAARQTVGVNTGYDFFSEMEAQEKSDALWAKYGDGNPDHEPVIAFASEADIQAAAVAAAGSSTLLGETNQFFEGSARGIAITLYPQGQTELVLDHEMAHAVSMSNDPSELYGVHGADFRSTYNTILTGEGHEDFAAVVQANAPISNAMSKAERVPRASITYNGKTLICY
jgi:hypothetical protein